MSDQDFTPKLIRTIKEILARDRHILDEHLAKDEAKLLLQVKAHLGRNRTGRYRPPTKNYDRLGQFLFFTLIFPRGCQLQFSEEMVVEFRASLVETIRRHFGEEGKYELGFILRPHFRITDVRAPSMHFHFVISRFRFLKGDSVYLTHFSNLALRDKRKQVLFFLRDPLVCSEEAAATGFESTWHKVIEETSPISIPRGHSPLVNVSTREEQDEDDRKDACEYLPNDPLHVFRYVWIATGDTPGFVNLLHIDKSKKTVLWKEEIEVTPFVREYLLLPNRILHGVRWGPYGFLRHCRFTPVIEVAKGCSMRIRRRTTRLLDLPIDFLAERALLYCREYSPMGNPIITGNDL